MPPISATGDGRRHAGFTLIELLVVLTIMVLLSVSLPIALDRMLPARRARVAAENLISDIRWLQEQAARGSQPARLELIPGGYRLTGPDASARQIDLARSTSIGLNAPGERRPLQQLIFYSDGTATPGRFEIQDSGREVHLEVSMLTGRARQVHGNS